MANLRDKNMPSTSSNATLKLAAAQIDSSYGDLDANLAKHLHMIEDARKQSVSMLLFPELSLCGHSAGKDALRLALRLDHPAIAALAEASVDLHTSFGFIEEAPGGQFYNSQATVTRSRVVHVHRKVQLATYGKLRDGLYYAPGAELGAFDIDSRWRVATPICNDLWNPGLVHDLMCDGVTLLAAPISSAREAVGGGFDNPSSWELNLRFYAVTYGVAVVMANRVGTEGMLGFWGGSRILDPFGNAVATGSMTDEELVVGELDYASLREARFLLPTVRDARVFAGRSIRVTQQRNET
ncbi:Glutamine amidotransferase chain of NAD synthetase [Paraburkholderia caribensis MBA4]|uniref:Glutamine amidotransferase chain of NAD synthetase n=1 Tax=Paraburkholderia caribensis MBA4 TaxID=1323664 RepID=A0A0P0RIP4_9BURK|nr:nitrilase-related carbon-nitrogen hydrolase [Paraburkholderia caribensis]ALL68633.1 Glutamine amidotransferase chain of NAD synthetase [Paraburkholderia caribensis MBA4]